jgi:signal transduction histidine kinase
MNTKLEETLIQTLIATSIKSTILAIEKSTKTKLSDTEIKEIQDTIRTQVIQDFTALGKANLS